MTVSGTSARASLPCDKDVGLMSDKEKAVPYLKQLIAGFSPRRSGFGPRMWDLWSTKWD